MPATTAVGARELPRVIQGGMGVAVSGWRLARAVAETGQLGVVSGTALDAVMTRRLQLGDPGGHVRRALAAFPAPELARAVVERFHVPGGVADGARFRTQPMLRADKGLPAEVLTVLGNFVEVWLAKEGHQGQVGVNYLEKVQLATAPAMFGAILAGVDHVLVGAGLPGHIPGLARQLSRCEPVTVHLRVEGDEETYAHRFDPRALTGEVGGLRRPQVLAIVSLPVLASYLARDEATRPDGFVVETHWAGGHSAPPRGALRLGSTGEPLYGARDLPDLAKMTALGIPYWLAGGTADPAALATARAAGAAGVQIGSAFALCEESGIEPGLRAELARRARDGSLNVRNDPAASPTAFPFKVADLPGTLADEKVRDARRRVCDLGYLRTPYRTDKGAVGYRCPAEPQAAYARKGGEAGDTEGRLCLCNGLLATVGLAQRRPGGGAEPPVVTIGQDLGFLAALSPDGAPYGAADVVGWMLAE
ncbi:nitronate monooxygenase [Streptomyces beijiangensis]|uniref:Nitronate monooxygenase n=1 Tax=Streptomyces beijiangensis TaxID=163361 RepID=A0A939FG94_9ACTN|nr:nitronate monooxygenase [Streptomyces beijiangensis]MBO0516837.1 nitronate monooxygenase [Streptomyces beijiangensis]